MANDVPRQTFQIKDLPTRSVTLYPFRAQIVRDIHDVTLQPGLNEIEIYGITPTADEHSVQIDGKGAATITDLTVDLVPNHEIFEEVYPEDEDTSDGDDSEDEDDEPQECKDIENEIAAMRSRIDNLLEVQKSCDRRLEVLDRYSSSLRAEHNTADDVVKLLGAYETQRAGIFDRHSKAAEEIKDLNKKIEKKHNEGWKAGKEHRKKQQKLAEQKEKERTRKERQKAEKRKQAQRIKDERLRFWPKKVYKVTLQLETASLDTPASSRRGSMDSVTLAGGKAPQSPPTKGDTQTDSASSAAGKETAVSLSLSYGTREANWTPCYDLAISSVNKSANIVYRAEFTNATSETWKDASLTLSTSQTSYQGLDDTVPFMHPWRIRLAKSPGVSVMMSGQEHSKPPTGGSSSAPINRNDLFGVDNTFVPVPMSKHQKKRKTAYVPQDTNSRRQTGGLFGPANPFHGPQVSGALFGAPTARQGSGGGLFGSLNAGTANPAAAPHSHPSGGLFGGAPSRARSLFGNTPNNNTSNSAPQAQPALFGSTGHHAVRGAGGADTTFRSSHGALAVYAAAEEASEECVQEEMGFGLFDSDDPPSKPSAIGYEESEWTDSGLTATYDVPGMRTLAPSSSARRHKIASLNATNIHMSYILVPKLRAAAFLRAKVRNPSGSISLLKGSAGVTLDGSFLGTMTLPRVSPGQIFDLPLGVDPSVHVSYPKPSVKRATQGIFQKELAQTFSRAVWLTNTKSSPVELLVLDQVPMSEDERLKIEVVSPKGIVKEGDAVRAGQPAKEAALVKKEEKWGTAVARMKKDGEVAWTVHLEKGGQCLLKLDYEARLPNQERIVQA